MRFLAAGTLVGTFGWLVAESVRVSTGSEALAALCFGLTASLMVWGFELRRKLDEPEQSGEERREGVAVVERTDGQEARQLAADGEVGAGGKAGRWRGR